MAQYTRCVEYDDFKRHWQGSSQNAALPLFLNALSKAFVYMILGALGGAAVGLFGGGLGALIGAGTGAYIGFSYGFVEGFCDQWLNWRLICIERDQCAGGQVAWIETVAAKFGHDPIEWLFDNDLSFNLRLLPYSGTLADGRLQFPKGDTSITYKLDQIVADPFPAANLLRKPQAHGSDWDLRYEGYEGGDQPDHPGGRWTLHSEIEGNGMQTLCTIAKVLAILGPLAAGAGAIGGAIVGAVTGAVKGYQLAHDGCKKVCSIPIPCDVVCFLAGVAAAIVGAWLGATLGALAGVIPGLGQVLLGAVLSTFIRHNGEFTDVANDPESGHIAEGDCVFVRGDEVYDAGHDQGWAEIHPVRHLQKTPPCPNAVTGSDKFKDPAFVAEVKSFWNTWCDAVATGQKPETKAAQDEPKNKWCLHPLVDGCRSDEPPPIG